MPDLTTEQHARCAELAKRYAELVPDWAQPGMSLLWPDDPVPWRVVYTAKKSLCMRNVGEGDEATHSYTCDAVPDWTDACTLGALLLGLGPQVCEHDVAGRAVSWWPHMGDDAVCTWGPWCDTRAEAILAACVAAAEATHGNL